MKQAFFDYELLDSGEGRRLEKIGGVVVDRPAVQAFWPKNKKVSAWNNSQAVFDKNSGGWKVSENFPENWQLKIGKVMVELKMSGNGQVGIFPEQLENWQWLIKKLEKIERPVKILNTFAYTGVATLLMSAANENVEVWHVDGARSVVSWAKQNAKLSGLEERPIHWIVEDVMKFLEREVKRGHKYDGLILDPPAFGRGEGSIWKLERDLPKLMDLAEKILSDKLCFVILSCHAQNINSRDLLFLLQDLKQFKGQKGEAFDLIIPSAKGHDLPAGFCARI